MRFVVAGCPYPSNAAELGGDTSKEGFCGLAAVSPKSGCVVLSTRGIGEEYVGGSGSTLPKAMTDAQKKLYGSQVKSYMCS